MADKNVKIGIVTTADTSGAEKAEESIKRLSDVTVDNGVTTKQVGQTADEALDGTRQKIEELRERSKALKQETEEFEESQKDLNTTLNLSRSAMVGVGAGGAIVAKIFKQIGEAISSIDIDHLRDLSPVMAQQVEEVKGLAEVLTDPINGIQRLLSGLSIGDAFGGLNEQLRLNAENAVRTSKEIAESRLKAVTDKQAEITTAYNTETAALQKQKTELERILTLREQLATLANEGFDQEVQAAETRGGDVGLAKANALAARLQQGLEGLTGTLQQAEADRSIAQKNFDSALGLYQQGVSDGLQKLDSDKLSELATAVDAAQNQLTSAKQSVEDQAVIFAEAKTNLLRGAENQLASLEKEYSGKISTEANSVLDRIYQTLKDQVSAGSINAVNQIQAAIDPVAAAAENKANEVSTAISRAAQFVGNKGDDMVAAFSRFDVANKSKDDRILAALNKMATAIETTLNQLPALNTRIDAILQRLETLEQR